MKDEELIANIRDAYSPAAVDADRFDAALHARMAQPNRRRGWLWAVGGGLAVAAAIVLWLGGAQVEPQPVDAPVTQMAAATPTVPPSAGATTLPAESTWLAAMEYEPELSMDDIGGLTDEYDELADFLEL